MIQVITEHSVNDILNRPEDYIDIYIELALVKIVDKDCTTIIMIGEDNSINEYYFVVEDEKTRDDIYPCAMGMTLTETFDYICSEVQSNKHR